MTELSPRELALRDYDENLEKYWERAFSELEAATPSENKMWLVGPSSYLFSIGGIKFAVDPQIRREKDFEALSDRLCGYLSTLSFVLITHQHGDHFCAPLIKKVKELPLVWYLPAKMPKRFIESAELDGNKCVFLNGGDCFSVGGLRITAFESAHVRHGSTAEMPELGYHFAYADKSIILPADVRDYDFRVYPEFDDVDLCISHLWAGDNAIDSEAYLPILDKFVEFSLSLRAKRYFICHLYEIGREEKFMWHDMHAKLAIERFSEKAPEVSFEIPRLSLPYELF